MPDSGLIDGLLHEATDDLAAGRVAQAMENCRRVLRLEPGNSRALHRLALAARETGDHQKALELLFRATHIDPENAEAQSDLGRILLACRETGAAIGRLELALKLDPNRAEDYAWLAYGYRKIGRSDIALEVCNRAVALFPDDPRILERLASTLITQGRIDEALNMWRKAVEEKKDFFALGCLLLCQHYVSGVTAEQTFRDHLLFGDLFERPLLKFHSSHTNVREPERHLRVGYVSADFCRHPVAQFLWPLLHRHDRERHSVYCYSATTKHDERTKEFRELAGDGWRDITRLSDDAAENVIREDQIDILVDVGGHTAANRLLLFARKPAPVQATWLGYPDTTGLRSMDYRITDALADPIGKTEKYHTENLIRLPGSFLCFGTPDDMPDVAPPPHLKNGFITFGSFNNFMKFSEPSLKAWAEILKVVEKSRLILKHNDAGDLVAQSHLSEAFADLGIARDRILIHPVMPLHRFHLDSYSDIDIALDPFPYNGTTTTCEAVAMGVPVLAVAGETHVSRVGVTLLSSVGLEGWIAASPSDYVELARRYAADSSNLLELRAQLRERLSACDLGQPERFARRMENAYRDMWKKWCVNLVKVR